LDSIKPRERIMKTTLPIICLFFAGITCWSQNVSTLQLERSAAHYARCSVVESVSSIELQHSIESAEIGSLIKERISTKTHAKVVGVRVVETRFDPELNWAVAKAEFPLKLFFDKSKMSPNAAQAYKNWGNKKVVGYGYASTDPEMLQVIKAVKRATLDAYAKLAIEMQGSEYTMDTRVSNEAISGRFQSVNRERGLCFAFCTDEPDVDFERRQVEVQVEIDLDTLRLLIGDESVKVSNKIKGTVRVSGVSEF